VMYMLPDACCSTSSRDDMTLCSNVIAAIVFVRYQPPSRQAVQAAGQLR
jgi:hypothetical protein